MAKKKKKQKFPCQLPPSKYPADIVRQLVHVAFSLWNSKESLLDDWCFCKDRGEEHSFCLYGKTRDLGKAMGWDVLFRGQKDE
jgi:hypothetical protein